MKPVGGSRCRVRRDTWVDSTWGATFFRWFLALDLLGRTWPSKKQAEQELGEQLDFERLIAHVTSQLVDVPVEQIDQTVNRALRLIGTFMRADRSLLFQFSAGYATLNCTHEWHATDVAPAYERLLMDLVVEGLQNKAIANRLGVSVRTVENRRREVFAKMQAASVAELVRLVLAAGEADVEANPSE